MAYEAKTYTLKEEAAVGGTRYSISFKDGQGESHELEKRRTPKLCYNTVRRFAPCPRGLVISFRLSDFCPAPYRL